MLSGTNVFLGPVLPQDFSLLFQWADDLEAAQYNETYRPPLWKQQEELWFPRLPDPSRVLMIIRRVGSSTAIGYVQIWNIDAVHQSAILGLRIGSEQDRSQGLGKEAFALAIDYCWNHLHLSRIALSVFANNSAAVALYLKTGFVEEGRLKQAAFIDGSWVDILLMALIHPRRAHS